MDLFFVLQILFDAVLFFGLLFLFHFSVHQSQKKKEEWEILKNAEAQDVKENLRELLMTLKQLGKEVSDNIQEQVQVAEEKTEIFKKVTVKLQRDLQKVAKLAEEVDSEKFHLEEKLKVIETAKRNSSVKYERSRSQNAEQDIAKRGENKMIVKKLDFGKAKRNLGFSAGVVQEVYRLSDEKLEMGEIVQRTKLSRAEIQLILNLRGNGFTTPN